MDPSTDQTVVSPTTTPAATPTATSSTASGNKARQDPRYAAYVPSPVVGSSTTVTNPNSPFYIKSNNAASHKFKYPETKPTPPGEDDVQWGKIYTAADSRKYNHHGKSSTESKKFRVSGETYTLALTMLVENKIKYGTAVEIAIAAGEPIPTEIPRATPKAGSTPKAPVKSEPRVSTKKEQPCPEPLMGSELLSISEKIKSQARVRTPSALSTNSLLLNQSASPTQQEMDSSKKNSPAPRPKTDKMPPKKRPNNASARPPIAKKLKINDSGASTLSVDRSATHSPMPDDGSITAPYAKEDQGFDAEGNPVYCICRGPDTESKMINCAGCNDWFHITCMGFSESQVDDLMEDYYCPACTTDTKFTKFRKLCRWANIHKKFPKIPDCSKPARVEINSKYCSEAHGIAFWKFVANVALRQTMDPSNGGVMNTEEFSRIVLSTKKLCVLKGLGEKPAFERQPASDTPVPAASYFLAEDERLLIDRINVLIEDNNSHSKLLDKMRQFMVMVEARARLAADYLKVDVTSICGYDKRLAMNATQFEKYLKTAEAVAIFDNRRLGPPTEDSKAFTEHIPCESMPVYQGCGVPAELDGICLSQWIHSHKSKKNCQHNTVGGIYWRNKYKQEYDVGQLFIRQQTGFYQELIKKIHEAAEERQILQPIWAHNITEVVSEAEPSFQAAELYAST